MRGSTVLWALVAGLFVLYNLRMVLPGLATAAVIMVGSMFLREMTRRI